MRARTRFVTAAAALLCLARAAGASAASGAAAPREVFANGGEVYLVDTGLGTVQWVDDASLMPRGPVRELGGPLERPVVDPEGVLWATLRDSGRVTGIHRDAVSEPIDVAEPGHALQLTMAGGVLAATDHAKWVYVFDRDGVKERYPVQLDAETVGKGRLRVPEYTESPYLPLLGNRPWGTGVLPVLVTVDLRSGAVKVRKVANGMRPFEPPHAVGDRLFVADSTQYRILEFDATSPEDADPDVIDLPARRDLDQARRAQGLARLRGDVPMTVRHGEMFYRETHEVEPAAGR